MVIDIPDEILENELQCAFGKMPPTRNNNPDNRRDRQKSSPVLHRIGYEVCHTNHICLTMVRIYRAIWRELKKRKIILYNFETDTWQGADYNDKA